MPTGYTADVGDGKVTEFTDFALQCSRAFGSLVMLRDHDQSLEATRRYVESEEYLEGSDYYERAMATTKQRIADLEAMSDEEAQEKAQAELEEVRQRSRKYNEERVEKKGRYEAMLTQVDAWVPPTADHVEMKKFMREQLTGSIDFDCAPYQWPLPDVSPGWRDREIASLYRSLARDQEHVAAQEERNRERKQWVTALLDSLEGVPV